MRRAIIYSLFLIVSTAIITTLVLLDRHDQKPSKYIVKPLPGPDQWDYKLEPEPQDPNQKQFPGIDDYVAVDINPEPVKIVQPKYPESAIRAKIEGTVYLKVLVSKQGFVDSAVVIKNLGCNEEMLVSSVDAARQWKFSPAKKDKKAVKVWVMMPLRFRMK